MRIRRIAVNAGRLRNSLLITTCALSFALTGCSTIVVGAYPDASMARASADDLIKSSRPLRLRLEVEWQFQGHPPSKEKGFMEIQIPPPDMDMLKQKFTEAFRRTGVVEIVQESAIGTAKITLNDVSDIADAIDKGTRLGRSLGDGYITTKEEFELSLSLQQDGASASSPAIPGAYYSVTAKSKLPDDARLRPAREVFDDMLEQMLIKCLLDLQRSGALVKLARR